MSDFKGKLCLCRELIIRFFVKTDRIGKRRLCLLAIVVAGILCGLSTPKVVRAKTFEESKVKAVFLFNLTKFVSWPTNQSALEKNKFCIGVLGRNPFAGHLHKVVKDEKIIGYPVEIVHFATRSEIDWRRIDLLFICRESLQEVSQLIELSRENKVFTVGEVKGFCQYGGMVNLLTEGRRVKLEVNIDETRRNNFQVRAQVLKLARIVKTSVGQGDGVFHTPAPLNLISSLRFLKILPG